MHRYRIPATLVVAAIALVALLGATRHTPSSASPKVTGTDALATPTGAPYLHLDAARLAKIRQEKVAAFLQAVKAQADAKAAAGAKAQAAAQAQAQAARAKAVRTSAAAPGATPSGSTAGHACGGDLPPCCVMMRESHGNPTAVNPSSGASGKWQFMPGTWGGYGGYATAAQAPEAVQDARARQIYANGAGAGHWAGSGC